MNNEPVVWILGGHLDSAKKMIHLCRVAPTQVDEGYVPLYTQPAELTDEEIITLWNDLVDRTILRKAQEK